LIFNKRLYPDLATVVGSVSDENVHMALLVVVAFHNLSVDQLTDTDQLDWG
jgi:hypothetical protein